MRSFALVAPLLAVLVAAPSARADEEAKSDQSGKPIQLALFDPVQIFPNTDGISGFRLNIIYSKNAFMKGFDLGLVNSISGEVDGVQWGFVDIVGGNFTGWQYGLANINGGDFTGWQASWVVSITDKKMVGLQTGIYNSAGDASGLQFGLVNHAVTMNGLQLGLVNIIEKGGMLPVFVIFNASFH